MSEAQIDHALKEVLAEFPQDTNAHPRQIFGKVFKAFYSKVDRSSVDADIVKRRAEALLNTNCS